MHKSFKVAAIAALAVAGGLQTMPAFADYQTPEPTSSISGWMWTLPTGETWGSCAVGYSPQWNVVHDYQHRPYMLTLESADGTLTQLRNYTWQDVLDAIASGKTGPGKTPGTWMGVADVSNGVETTLPLGAPAPAGELSEGDCVPDGYVLPAPNPNYDGNGVTYLTPTEKRETVVDQPATPEVPAVPEKGHTEIVPGTPAVTRTESVYASKRPVVMALVQDDFYLNTRLTSGGKKVALSKAEIAKREAARRADAKVGKLYYRKGSAAIWLWGTTTSTVKRVDLCSLTSEAANEDRWVLPVGADAAHPWGKNPTSASYQTSPVAKCAPVKVQVGTRTVVVKPATPATTRYVVDVPAQPAIPAKPAVTHEVVTHWCGEREVGDLNYCPVIPS